MDKFFKKWQYILLVGILCLGFWLRANNLFVWPRVGATFDEYAWTWLGMSIIQNHIPTSWSPHPQYTHAKDIIYQKTHFRLVTPYLEHPPLFGIVAGEFALLSGAKDMFHVDIEHIRGLALILGLLSILLVFVLVKEVYTEKIALLSAFIYASMPSVVVGSRLVENENFFIPMFLFSLFLTSRFIKTKKIFFLLLSSVVCGLLSLAKVPWLAAGVSSVLLLVYYRHYKKACLFAGVVLLFFSSFFIWGIYWNKELFFSLWGLQLNRYDITFTSIFALFTDPVLTDRQFLDGWIYFGWIAVFLLMVKDVKKHVFIILPFLVYFAVFVYAIPNEPGHGWYRYPFNPFFAVAIALFIQEYFSKNYLLTFFFFLFTGLSMLGASWEKALGFSFFVFRFFLVLYSLTLLPLFFPKTKRLATWSSYVSLGSVFLLTLWSVFSYTEQ